VNNSPLITASLKKIPNNDLTGLLKKPFIWREAVSHCFCSQCQTLGEINLDHARGLIRTMRILGNLPEATLETPADLAKYYFITGYCETCGIGPVSVKIKKIGEN